LRLEEEINWGVYLVLKLLLWRTTNPETDETVAAEQTTEKMEENFITILL